MPILDDIMDHDLLGPLIREGMEKGELKILHRQLVKRFGALPTTVDERLSHFTAAELEDLSLRIFDAKTLDDLFPH